MEAEERLEVAFADTPRPPDDALLHPRCVDDMRHLGSGAAVVDSTIWSLDPAVYADPELADFTRSKFVSLAPAEREAIVACLEAILVRGREYESAAAGRALAAWRS